MPFFVIKINPHMQRIFVFLQKKGAAARQAPFFNV
jgi:hypothetical protein